MKFIEIQCNQVNPIETARTIFLGTYNMLDLAKSKGAKFLLASTSEVYGDPEQHPQNEEYRGSVNTTGTRSCYVEGNTIFLLVASDVFDFGPWGESCYIFQKAVCCFCQNTHP